MSRHIVLASQTIIHYLRTSITLLAHCTKTDATIASSGADHHQRSITVDQQNPLLSEDNLDAEVPMLSSLSVSVLMGIRSVGREGILDCSQRITPPCFRRCYHPIFQGPTKLIVAF